MLKIVIDISNQCLQLLQDMNIVAQYAVSTAKNGPGQLKGSECTPTGRHIIRAKIGDGQPINTVFRGRRPTGEIYSIELAESNQPDRDWILTRILWLSGNEIGHNRLGNVDTMQRYIYIHGSPDSTFMAKPQSHGCVRMRNRDLISLFDEVPVGTEVLIKTKESP